MESFWDYFMRRKISLFLLLTCSAALGWLGFYSLQGGDTTQYISIRDWGASPEESEIEIPHTGSSTKSIFGVLSPAEVVAIYQNNPTEPSSNDSIPEDFAEPSTEQDSPDDIQPSPEPEPDVAPEVDNNPSEPNEDTPSDPDNAERQLAQAILAPEELTQPQLTEPETGGESTNLLTSNDTIHWNFWIILAGLADLTLLIYLIQQHFYR